MPKEKTATPPIQDTFFFWQGKRSSPALPVNELDKDPKETNGGWVVHPVLCLHWRTVVKIVRVYPSHRQRENPCLWTGFGEGQETADAKVKTSTGRIEISGSWCVCV